MNKTGVNTLNHDVFSGRFYTEIRFPFFIVHLSFFTDGKKKIIDNTKHSYSVIKLYFYASLYEDEK